MLDIDPRRAERKQIPVALEVSLVVNHQIAQGARRRVDDYAVEASEYPMAVVPDLDAGELGKRAFDICGGEVAQPHWLSRTCCD